MAMDEKTLTPKIAASRDVRAGRTSSVFRSEDTETEAMNEESYWQAVQTRDTGADGLFFYGVRSTGIYCRPTCPSRRPRREQVVFFRLPEAAEQAGFRPCRRCHPHE